MIFRGRNPETSIWHRFRSATDSFTFSREKDHYAAHVVANAERVVDLFHTLLAQLPPAVDMVVLDERSGRSWKGEALPLPDVRDAIARLKAPLAEGAGVELAVYTSEDQLTLNGMLELFIYARTDAWYYVLQGKGLEESRRVRTRSWRGRRRILPSSPQLATALEALVTSLGLAALED